MVKKRKSEITVTASSGNVFADLGSAESEEELTKAQLASHIRQVIKRRRLTQVMAATLSQPCARTHQGRPGVSSGARPRTKRGPSHTVTRKSKNEWNILSRLRTASLISRE
jgi:hypothetical protein